MNIYRGVSVDSYIFKILEDQLFKKFQAFEITLLKNLREDYRFDKHQFEILAKKMEKCFDMSIDERDIEHCERVGDLGVYVKQRMRFGVKFQHGQEPIDFDIIEELRKI